MRALVLKQSAPDNSTQRASLRDDYPKPCPSAGESLVRVRLAGICGTDLEMLRGYMGFSGVPGHEFVGEVVQTQTPRLRGKRVVGEINAACGRCEWCQARMGRHCPNRTVLGILGRDGAFAEFLRLPDSNLIPVSDNLPDETAVFAEPLAAAFEIFEQTRIAQSDRIAILGDGRLGAITALAMRAHGLSPTIGGHHAAKLRHLAEMGIAGEQERELQPGFDMVVDCTGSAQGLSRALQLVRPRGRLVLKTTVAGSTGVNLAPIVINEIDVIGSRCGRMAPAVEALEHGLLDPRPLVSATFPLADALAALERASQTSSESGAPVFKVLLKAF
jgi:threonine dehydrogenase-like Zn-dependent dehydrogenase